MSEAHHSPIDFRRPVIYEIRLQGHLNEQWTAWFEGLTITLADGGETILTGPVADQAALFGLLRKVRDLGLPLLSVICTGPARTDTGETNTIPSV